MTLQEWQDELTMWTTARQKILEGNQRYTSPDGSEYTRADLAEINRQITRCRNTISIISGQGFTAQQMVFGGRR
jgi:hypothetical protein